MHKSMIAALMAGTVALSACTTYGDNRMAGTAATGAAYGGAPLVPGVSVAEGALAGAAIGGIANAVWADRNNDGFVDGYVQNGNYYSGTPQGYDPTLRRVATAAVMPGMIMPTGAVTGAAVDGLAGAVWADNNGDGRADGYVYNGQYYPGAPQGYQPQGYPQPAAAPAYAPPQPAPAPAPAPMPARGERG